MLETDHKIIRIANCDAITLRMLLSPRVDPQIENVVQEHIRKQRRYYRSLGRALAVITPIGSFDGPRLKPLENQSNKPLVSDPMFDEPHQPVTVDVVEETFDVGVQYPVHSLFGDRNVQRIKSLMLATVRPETIAETDEVFLVDTLQNRADSLLNDLVFERRDPQRTLTPVGLFDVYPFGRRRPKGSAVNATMEIDDAVFVVLLVFVPAHSIDPDGCFLLELVKARSQQFDTDVMKQVCELELSAFLRRLTHTVQPA